MKTLIQSLSKKAKAIFKHIIQVIQKLKTVFAGRCIQQNINIEIKTSDNSELQIVLKLKTVFVGKNRHKLQLKLDPSSKKRPNQKMLVTSFRRT